MITREDIFNMITPMLATLAGKDVKDKEVAACANAILELVGPDEPA